MQRVLDLQDSWKLIYQTASGEDIEENVQPLTARIKEIATVRSQSGCEIHGLRLDVVAVGSIEVLASREIPPEEIIYLSDWTLSDIRQDAYFEISSDLTNNPGRT